MNEKAKPNYRPDPLKADPVPGSPFAPTETSSAELTNEETVPPIAHSVKPRNTRPPSAQPPSESPPSGSSPIENPLAPEIINPIPGASPFESPPAVVDAVPVVASEVNSSLESIFASNIVEPNIVEPNIVEPNIVGIVDAEVVAHARDLTAGRSWVFRCIDFCGSMFRWLFGIVSIVLLLSITANIPVLQLISFGYLLEVTGRLARGGRFRDAMVGLSKASRVGGALLGAWIVLLPARYTWLVWYEALLIAPDSPQTRFMRIVHLAVTAALVAHILAAWFCGGKLRYFFWPLVAPFSFAVWLARRLAGIRAFRHFMDITLGWISPHLVNNICTAAPPSDFFLPAIVWKRIRSGNALIAARDGVWNFVTGLRLPYYFTLGFNGFVGSLIWLLIPTALLIASTELSSASGPNPVPAVLAGLLGTLIAVPVFSLLPFAQAHFATDGKIRRFFEPLAILKNWGKAPFVHILALLITLLFALPLYLTKIVEIPTETLWALSVIFILFSWPARIAVGWAYGRGAGKTKPGRLWIGFPALIVALPISFVFVFVMFFTRYITWNGAWSLIENHVFLLPAPFWL